MQNKMKKLQIRTTLEVDTDMVDAFSRLRVNLGLYDDNINTIIITSSVSGEGKSFVSMQLWKQFAEVGSSTLLIDCDLQSSQLCSKYAIGDMKELKGITQYLSGQAELEDILYETDVPNGYILPLTFLDTRPDVLFTDKRFSQMIESCKKKFGNVLLDMPAMNNLPDVINVATHCDGLVFVVRSGSTSRKMVCECVQTLQCTGTPLLGIVLNCFDVNNKSSSYYYQHRHI